MAEFLAGTHLRTGSNKTLVILIQKMRRRGYFHLTIKQRLKSKVAEIMQLHIAVVVHTVFFQHLEVDGI